MKGIGHIRKSEATNLKMHQKACLGQQVILSTGIGNVINTRDSLIAPLSGANISKEPESCEVSYDYVTPLS